MTNIEPNEPINVTPMSAQEARECVATIKHNLESLGAMLLDLDRRRGWEALGYTSFRECAVTEFGKSQGYVYKLLHAAEVDENLAASEVYPLDKSEIGLIPTSHKEELHKLPNDQQAAALKKADALAQMESKPREARHVASVVKEYKSALAETEAKGQALGLPTRGDSTLPESDSIDDLKHTNPNDVDDRLGAPPTPSPWSLIAEFSLTVGDGSTVQVKFIPEGLTHRFEFKGVVSQTGFYCEFIPAQTAQSYPSPKECAQAIANNVHARWMKMKAKDQAYKHSIAPGDTVRVLLGKGRHSDKITTATSVTAKEIVTPLGVFKPSALVKYVDRSAEIKALGIVPGTMIEANDGTRAEVICTFGDGRVLVSGGRYYRYSELTAVEPESVEAEENAISEAMPKAIAASVEAMLPEILANDCESLAQTSDLIDGEAEQEKLAYFMQALQEAQAEISRLKDERDSLETECLALHAQNGDLINEIAHLLGELAALKQQICS